MRDGWTLTAASPARALVDLLLGGLVLPQAPRGSDSASVVPCCPSRFRSSCGRRASRVSSWRRLCAFRTFSQRIKAAAASRCQFHYFFSFFGSSLFMCAFFFFLPHHLTYLERRQEYTNTHNHINGFNIKVVFFSLRTIWSTFYWEKSMYFFQKPKAFEAPPAVGQFAVTSQNIFDEPRFHSHDFATFSTSIVR